MSDGRRRVDILFGLAYPDSRVRRAARALDAAGHDVRVLAWDRSGALPRRSADGGVHVEHARVPSRSGRGWTQLLYLAQVMRRHLRSLRADPPDVLHAVDLPMLVAALAVRPLIGRPLIVYDAFEIYALMEAHKYPGWLLRLIRLAERRLPRRADLVITPGQARQDYFAARGVKSVVVGNWMDAPASVPDRAMARDELSVAAQFTIAYVGGLEPSRDLAALVRHARQFPDDLVLIAGRGEQETMIAAAADELANLRFLGWVADPGVLYAAADAIYYALEPDHPYSAHPAPNNLYAAIAHGVPIVHRGQGELGAVAREAEIGPSFSHDPSLDAALDTLRDPAVQERVRASLRALQQHYSARRAAEALLAAYSSLAPRS
ncbi:MAG: glycosyltransferase [Candidatus Limnocylindria bacterium]